MAEIASKLHAAKSSVSLWTRDIYLADDIITRLRSNSHTAEAIEKRRQARLKSEAAKREIISDEAKKSVKPITHHDLWLIGTMLYWAEGGKTQRTVRFSNGDPEMIKVMMRYFREVCEVEEVKLRGHIHIHEHLDVEAAEDYWSSITAIPKHRFYKTYNKPNISSKGLRNTLPYGVFDIYVANVKLFLQIEAWIAEIARIINRPMVGAAGLEPATSRM